MAATIILDSKEFFFNMVEDAFEERKVDTYPQVKAYIVDVLKYYLVTENLYDEEDSSGKKSRKMLAELLLTATSAQAQEKIGRLKKLGDSSLYISGFFPDSFQRKIIDVDYYVDMGKIAYDSLSSSVKEDTFAKLYKEISVKFLDLVDALSLMSRKAKILDDENVLRLMDIYSKTGSTFIEETLVEKGLFNLPSKKQLKQ